MILILFSLSSFFNIEQITFNDQTDWVPTIAVDKSCKVHIAYRFPGQIRYITNKSGPWIIDSIIVSGSTPSIAVTPGGCPHIVYVANDGTDDEIYYATSVEGTWDIDTLTNNAAISGAPSIALAPDSTPHVVYYDFSGGLKIWHAYKLLGVWNFEAIPNSDIGTYSSIAVDSAGKVHVAFVTGTYGGNREIYYANNTSGTWVTEKITNDALDDDFPSVAVDKNSKAHIVYAKDDGADWELWYATNVSGSFVTTQLTNNSGIDDYGYPSIAIDKRCDVHIAYQENNTAGNLFYLTNTSGSWERDTIFIGPLNKSYSWVDRNIAIDTLGYIHVCFANQVAPTNAEIYHATSNEPVGIENLDFSAGLGNFMLYQNVPNPFSEKTRISYIVDHNAKDVSLKIYDASGRLVRQWDYESALGGMRLSDQIVWDGTDNFGKELSAGVYFCQMKSAGKVLTNKLILLK